MARKAKIAPREPLTDLEDLRDDCIGIALETKMSFKDIHEKGGPTPQTSAKWLYRETRFPQLATIRAMLRACDYDLTVAPQGEVELHRFSHSGIKYPETRKKKAPRRNGGYR